MLLSYTKRFAYTAIFYGASSTLVRLLSFFFLPYFLSQLSLVDFGVWDYYQLFFSMGTLLFSSCASTSMIRFYVLYKDSLNKQNQSIGNSFLLVLMIVLFFSLLIIGLHNFFFVQLFSSKFICITLANIIFFSCFSLVLALFRVQEKLWQYGFLFCGQNVVAIIGTLVGVTYGHGIEAFFYANLFSLCIWLPLFFYFLGKYNSYSLPLLKEQLAYSVPLFIYNILYMSFFSFDKLFIKSYLGLEALGVYSLLWRFGSIFQMVAIAMIDAWYLMVYNAQKENNGNYLISKLVTYYSTVLVSCCLYAIIGSYGIVLYVFPMQYSYITSFLPFFFLPLLFIEKARLFQTAFGLSTKTLYMPLISAFIVGLQLIFLFCFKNYYLWGIFLANSLSFLVYACICYGASLKIYPHDIINKEKISKLIALLCTFIGVMHCSINWYCMRDYSTVMLACISFLWPLCIWFFIIDRQEKRWLLARLNRRFYVRRVNE